jgi:hypothetical protein
MTFIPWDEYRQMYLIGSSRTTTGKPSVYTIKPDESILLYPIPNDVFTIVGEYFRTPDTMDIDADEPIFPERFHEAILYRAMMFYGMYSQEVDKYSAGEREYKRVMRGMRTLLPQPTWGAPLC